MVKKREEMDTWSKARKGLVKGFFYFLKQKTAYGYSACLVGSEICCRNRSGGARKWSGIWWGEGMVWNLVGRGNGLESGGAGEWFGIWGGVVLAWYVSGEYLIHV